MPFDIQQYQEKTEPVLVPTTPITQSHWQPAWSLPVRQVIAPRLAIALIASGLFAPVLTPTQAVPNLESKWHYAWSEPVRLKRGLHPSLHLFTVYLNITSVFVPTRMLYRPWVDPVRIKLGLQTRLQQFFAAPPRYLPKPNVTMTMAAIETNADIALFGIGVGDEAVTPPPIAQINVSIEEIPATGSGSASLEEKELF
jgi:hypothetical protein